MLPKIAECSQQVDSLLQKESQILEKVLLLVRCTKNVEWKCQQPRLTSAEEWILKADEIMSDLEKLTDDIVLAEAFFQKISLSESAQLTKRLIDVSNAINNITKNMYKIVNHNQNERMFAAKVIAQQRIKTLLAGKEEAEKLLESRTNFIRQNDEKKKEELKRMRETEIIEEMRSQALIEHKSKIYFPLESFYRFVKEYLSSLEAVKALEEVEENTFISNDSLADDVTLTEGNLENRKRRRSRSLTRKVVGTIKKTIRRSVSLFNNHRDHHQNPTPKI
ncbi:hypothetical protein B9Z55_019356 [Caenorhabditis nigoni]|uniref:Uncharacterized protein n=1 Tax=Caenorhabditis nigoni TaxID=1611254 RepID=A0A2G5TI49_9PELO|nr:hypothetical protein B9Z55_019356 [Caenorhabditis nigoni]